MYCRYSDVIHEIKPVVSGYRLTLIYNLHHTAGDHSTSGAMVYQERMALREILREWNSRYERRQPVIPILAYCLEHKYSTAKPRLEKLNDRDRLVGRYLKEACEMEGCTLLLANLDWNNYHAEILGDEDRLGEELAEKHCWTRRVSKVSLRVLPCVFTQLEARAYTPESRVTRSSFTHCS